MRISDRYRMVHDAVAALASRISKIDEDAVSAPLSAINTVANSLRGQLESVGEIPQFKLEQHLSPLLLTCHAQLDRARVMLERGEYPDEAAAVWEIEQQVYRLLNDL